MSQSDLLEEMLAVYPIEKREQAREICRRFADGDSTQFFPQLLVLFDVYARYVEHIPQRMIAANADTLATVQEVQSEIAHMVETIKTREVNFANHAETINEMCRATQAKCNEATANIGAAVKTIATQVDTQSIVTGIQTELKNAISTGILRPFIGQTERLATTATKTLIDLREAADQANLLWNRRIWWTVWTTSLVWCVFAALVFVTVFCWRFSIYYNRIMSAKIANTAQVIQLNQKAFRQLAIAQVPVKLVPAQNDDGKVNPQGFALVVEGAYAADMRQVNGQNVGCVFFNSNVPGKQIRQLQQELKSSDQETNNTTK